MRPGAVGAGRHRGLAGDRTFGAHARVPVQIKLNNQILAEDSHQPMYKVIQLGCDLLLPCFVKF